MAVAQANVSTVGGAVQADKNMKIGPKPLGVQTTSFRRTLQHYITNNNASSNESVGVATGHWAFKQGWHYIPHTYLRAAMTQADEDMIKLSSKQYRIKSQGFTIKKFNVIQEAVASNASTTSVVSTFVQAPCAMVYKDDMHEMFEHTFKEQTGVAIAVNPVWDDIGSLATNTPNLNNPDAWFATPFTLFANPANGRSGMLYTTQFQFSAPTGNTTPPLVTNFDLMNGGNIEIIQTGSGYSYTWENPSNAWHSTAMRVLTTTVPEDDLQWTVNGLIPDTIEMKANAATELFENVTNMPVMHLIRVPPVSGSLGTILVNCELWIEYHVEIEWTPGRYLFGRGVPSATTGDSRSVVDTLNPYPVNARAITAQPAVNDPELTSRRVTRACRISPYHRATPSKE